MKKKKPEEGNRKIRALVSFSYEILRCWDIVILGFRGCGVVGFLVSSSFMFQGFEGLRFEVLGIKLCRIF